MEAKVTGFQNQASAIRHWLHILHRVEEQPLSNKRGGKSERQKAKEE
jgi:hypothetical protein